MVRFGGYFIVAVAFCSFFTPKSCNIIEEILRTGEEAYNEEKSKPVNIPSESETFDFIIVGAGASGCVLANRLSENPDFSVLLIEAGGTETITSEIPVLAGFTHLTEANWKYQTTPQKNACLGMKDNRCSLPSGRVLGGSSAINFMVYSRGNRKDFDNMASAGNHGWSYDEVLPYFLRSEKAKLGYLNESPYHNTSGLQSVEHVQYRTPMAEAFVNAFKEMGVPEVDYNGESQLGTAYVQATTHSGRRHSAAKAFLEPIMHVRKNLRVLTFCQVTKILIDKKLQAYGIELTYNNENYTIKANKEVILSAGTFNSPQLLMLSGIGPRDALSKAAIKQVCNVPVGKVLYDHMSHVGPTFTTNSTNSTLYFSRITKEDYEDYKSGDPSTRLSTITGLEAMTFVDLPDIGQDGRPDVELMFGSASLALDNGFVFGEGGNFQEEIYTSGFKELENIEHFTVAIMQYHPTSSGRVWLDSKNPGGPPIIDPNYYDVEGDVEIVLAGIKEALRIVETSAMKEINATLFSVKVPGCQDLDFGTDEYWRCSIKVLTYSQNHQVGTCKMGPSNDPTAVVNSDLKVHGMKRLRVVDESVLPAPHTGHTGAISLMIGEKAADLIKKQWGQKSVKAYV